MNREEGYISDKKQTDIDDNNELIAIFNGWAFTTRLSIQCFVKEDYRKYHCDLKYHEDFNSLISVWYKFRDLRFEGVHEQFEHSEFRQNIAHQISYGTIETSYQAIVSGIQWYNSLNQKP